MSERPLLMIPGPTEIPWRVIRAMMRPSISHHDPKFNVEVLDATLIKLRHVFQTRNEVLALPGSGRVALETAITSVIEPGDEVLTVSAGVFGAWMTEMVNRVGGKATQFDVPPGGHLDLSRFEEMLRSGNFRAVTIVHNETSTGTMYDVAALAPLVKAKGALFLVDTVSSLGGVDIRTDEWQVDLNMTASQKCLAAPLGLALVSVSEEAWAKMRERKSLATSFSYDLHRWRTMWLPPERGGELIYGFRRQPVSMPVHLVYALAEAVDLVLEEGLAARFERHQKMSAALRSALGTIGAEIVPDEPIASPTVTCLRLPGSVSPKAIITTMAEEHRVQIASGMGALKDDTVRVGHMGVTASPEFLVPMVSALVGALQTHGVAVDTGAAVEAFAQAQTATERNT